jgi:hypothetical protein
MQPTSIERLPERKGTDMPIDGVQPTEVECKGTFCFSDDPMLMATLTSYLGKAKASKPCSSLTKLSDSFDIAMKHPSGGQMSGCLLEVAVALALTEATQSPEKDAFLNYMQRYECNSCKIPEPWKRLFQRIHVAPQRVTSAQHGKKFKSVSALLEAVTALEPDTYFAFCTDIFLCDTNNAGPDLIWFAGLSPPVGAPDGAVTAAAADSSSGFLIMFLAGLKWYGGKIPGPERDKNKRSVDPLRLYTDLDKSDPTPKGDGEQFKACQKSLTTLMKSKLAGVVSMEFLFEHDKGANPSKHKPFANEEFAFAGLSVPWLQVTVTKEMVAGTTEGRTPEEAFKTSPLYDFGAHKSFHVAPVSINDATQAVMVSNVIGVGKGTADAIIAERNSERGRFKDLKGAVKRLGWKSISSTVLARFSYE